MVSDKALNFGINIAVLILRGLCCSDFFFLNVVTHFTVLIITS